MKKLAIIIPAYKPNYLSETLESLAGQTNKNFSVYVGDDASPHDIKGIVDEFKEKIDIFYYRFNENLGAKSLVKQWERCVELSAEEWIWLFSDDDNMSPTAVESFYRIQNQKKDSHLFKFFTKMINAESQEIQLFMDKTNSEKDKISPQKYLDSRLGFNRFRSYMVEYIFSRKIYQKLKFIDFPLAWAADDANWINYAIENNGIDIIPDFVYWRFSGINISSDYENPAVVEKKLDAIQQFVEWLHTREDKIIIDKKLLIGWIINQTAFLITKKDKHSLISYIQAVYGYLFSKNEINTGVKNFSIKEKIKKLKDFLRP